MRNTPDRYWLLKLLLMALDEIGNLSLLPSLPVLQSLSQARDKRGDHAAGAIWDASIVKIILGGTSSARDLQDLSALVRHGTRAPT